MSDLPVRRMPAITQRVDHRVLEVCASPPGNEVIRLSVPALPLQERRDGLSKPMLHIDDGAVLVEGEDFYLAPQDIKRLNHILLHSPESRRGRKQRHHDFLGAAVTSSWQHKSGGPKRSV